MKISKQLVLFLSRFLVVLTALLIFMGSLVTSTGTGLSVPDWPTTYGYNMFTFPFAQMVGGIFYEHGHRLLASFVGFCTLVLFLLVWFGDFSQKAKRLGFWCLATVIIQGLFGGLTVLYFLPIMISMTHAVLAQTFFVLTIFLSLQLATEQNKFQYFLTRLEFRPAVLGCGLLFIQLLLGALVRHSHSGLAVYDFPTIAGQFWPFPTEEILFKINSWRFDNLLDAITLNQVYIHLAHRFFGLFTAVFVLYFCLKFILQQKAKHWLWVCILVLIQLILGASIIWTKRLFWVASLHVVLSAILLGLLTRMVWSQTSPEHEN